MEIKIKDFIVNGEIPTKEATPKTKTPTEYQYILEYTNDTDFILRKQTAKTNKLLVVLISQGQIYIKDEIKNTIEKVTSINTIRNFVKHLYNTPDISFTKMIWTPFEAQCYSDKLTPTDEFDWVMTHDLEVIKLLMNKKINCIKSPNIYRRYMISPDSVLRRNELIKIAQLINENFNPNNYYADDILDNLAQSGIQYNTIKANKDLIDEIGGTTFLNLFNTDTAYQIFKDYLCDFKSFLNYLLYTIKYRNGLGIGNYNGAFNVRDYVDYLRQQKEMYGKVKEKYPQYWLSEERMMSNKYHQWRKLKDAEGFDLGQESLKRVEYSDDTFSVIVPLRNTDILDEAEQQQHCVASYVDKIRRGETHIVFIRLNLDLETSLLTVEINNNDEIIQVRGFQNRMYNGLEYRFMKKWAEERNLKLEVREVV